MRILEGLGINVPASAAIAAQGAMAAQAAVQPSVWDDISKAVSTLAPAAAQAYVGLQTAKAIKKSPIQQALAPQAAPQPQIIYQQAPGMSNTMKIALAAGGAALVIAVLLLALRKRGAAPR